MKTRIILAGGFLGAGKTTLLMKAGLMIGARGIRAGLITNDQAPELVDSVLLRHEGLRVGEVSGSCFCCNYNGFVEAAQAMRRDAEASVIIAEPVGSCTDLSATIVQPLKAYGKEDFEVAPLSVLADPARLSMILAGGSAGLHADAAYIYRKQLEEADLILITKADAYSPAVIKYVCELTAANFPWATVLVVSAMTGRGMDEWLDIVLSGKTAGQRIATVDYDRYANGEAALGWLNGTVFMQGKGVDWNKLAADLMRRLADSFRLKNYPVGHLKIIIENCEQYIIGHLTDKGGAIALRGAIDAGNSARLTINARVETSPEELEAVVKHSLACLAENKFSTEIVAWRCLSPGRPQPTHRFAEVV